MLICGWKENEGAVKQVVSSGRCTCLMVHWRAVRNRMKHYWCATFGGVYVRVSHDNTYCNGWLNGLKLEEHLASFFWTHSPYLILGHPQKQFTSQHPEAGHSAVHEKLKNMNSFIMQYKSYLQHEHLKVPSPSALFHSHFGETFVVQPGFDLCRCGRHVQSHWPTSVPLWGSATGIKCHIWNMLSKLGYSAELRVTSLTGRSSMGPLPIIGSRTFWGTLPSSSRALRTSHHCLDFWTTCKKAQRTEHLKQINVSTESSNSYDCGCGKCTNGFMKM